MTKKYGSKIVKAKWGSYKVSFKTKRKTLRNSKMVWFKLKGNKRKYYK